MAKKEDPSDHGNMLERRLFFMVLGICAVILRLMYQGTLDRPEVTAGASRPTAELAVRLPSMAR